MTSVGGESRASEKLAKGRSVSAQEWHQAELQQCVSGSGPHTPEKRFRILEGSSVSEHSTVRESSFGSSCGRARVRTGVWAAGGARPCLGRLLR